MQMEEDGREDIIWNAFQTTLASKMRCQNKACGDPRLLFVNGDRERTSTPALMMTHKLGFLALSTSPNPIANSG